VLRVGLASVGTVLPNVELTGRRRRGALAARCMMNEKRLAAKVTCRWRSG
jgi:ABC-type thiamine transport system ATPase subunit